MCIRDRTYILPSKIQTDDLEFRFRLYRRLAGTQYHISVCQIFEIESTIRDFSVQRLTLNSGLKGSFIIDQFCDDTSGQTVEKSGKIL